MLVHYGPISYSGLATLHRSRRPVAQVFCADERFDTGVRVFTVGFYHQANLLLRDDLILAHGVAAPDAEPDRTHRKVDRVIRRDLHRPNHVRSDTELWRPPVPRLRVVRFRPHCKGLSTREKKKVQGAKSLQAILSKKIATSE